jgi:hypothetical protein
VRGAQCASAVGNAKKEIPMMTRTATALLAGALFLQPGLATADESHSLEQLVVEMADTPAEHAALAKHFQAKAADARASAAEHEAMAKSYSGGKLADRAQMQTHCKKLAEQYNAVATQYDDLAKLEEAAAKPVAGGRTCS